MNRDPEDARHPSDMRVRYVRSALDESHLAANPMDQFRRWFAEITESGVEREPNAMSLATVNAEGVPSVRTVLLKGGLEQDAFWFFTNYESRKGQDLAANPRAALTFLWREWERQVCVRGVVEKLGAGGNTAYFQSRPHESQIGAWVSRQSQPIPNRQWLEDRTRQIQSQYPEGHVPCPEFWGGYALRPLVLEFWQGRPGRLHDRFHFERSKLDAAWKWNRVCP